MASEQPAPVVVYLTAADIAGHLGVRPATVHTWRARYGPDRGPEAVAKAPTCPQPEPGVQVGLKRPVDVWLASRLPEWDAWHASLPGRGAGSGRPLKPADEATIRRRAVKGWAFMDLPEAEAAAIRAFLDGGDPAELPERWRRGYEREQRIALA